MDMRITGAVAASLILAGSCRNKTYEEIIVKAPFEISLGNTRIAVSPSSEISDARALKRSNVVKYAALTACSAKSSRDVSTSCIVPAALGSNSSGISIFLSAVRPGVNYQLLQPRTRAVTKSQSAPVPLDIEPFPEKLELHRITSNMYSKQLVTTSAHWPVATCGRSSQRQPLTCKVGIVTNGLFVESTWFLANRDKVSQDDLEKMGNYLVDLVGRLLK